MLAIDQEGIVLVGIDTHRDAARPAMSEFRPGANDMTETATSLQQMLQQLCDAATDERVSVDAMLEAVGRRSFGPLILLAGLVTLSPVGDIPSVPTMVAVLVLLLSTQLLWGRSSFLAPRMAASEIDLPYEDDEEHRLA